MIFLMVILVIMGIALLAVGTMILMNIIFPTKDEDDAYSASYEGFRKCKHFNDSDLLDDIYETVLDLVQDKPEDKISSLNIEFLNQTINNTRNNTRKKNENQ